MFNDNDCVTRSEFTSRIQSYGPVHPPSHASQPSRSIAISMTEDKMNESLSDTAICNERINTEQSSAGNISKSQTKNQSGLSKKSNSTSQLSVSGMCHLHAIMFNLDLELVLLI